MIDIKQLFSDRQKRVPLILSGIIVFFFLFSLIFFFAGKSTVRRIFIFPSADNGRYVVEYKNLPRKPAVGAIACYVDEILLGSGVERTEKLFNQETKVLSCFERHGVLYLNLSPELLNMGSGVVEIKDGIEILKMNIFKNFRKIKKIELFVNSKLAYEQ